MGQTNFSQLQSQVYYILGHKFINLSKQKFQCAMKAVGNQNIMSAQNLGC